MIIAASAALVGAASWMFGESATALASMAFSVPMACLAPILRRFGESREFIGHLVCGITVFFLIAMANLPVVVLSANAFAEDRSAALASGASDVLSKPAQQEDLAAALCRYGHVLPKAATPG